MSRLTEILAGVSLFQLLEDGDIDRISEIGAVYRYPAGSTVFRQGDPGESLFVVLEGSVKVVYEDDSDHPLQLAHIGPGGCFGEMALIDGDVRSATVLCTEDAELFSMGRDAFLGFIARSPPLLSRLLRELTQRIRHTTNRLYQGEMEARLRTAMAEAARQFSITQMVTGIAHEINTPLGVCTTSASLIGEMIYPLPERGAERQVLVDLREPVNLLVGNLERVVTLVQTFTEVAAAHHAEPLLSIDLVEAVQDSLVLFRNQPQGKGVDLAFGGAARRYPWIGYRGLLSRVLIRLFSNIEAHAYDRGHRGAAELAVAETALDGVPAYSIRVRDFGRGIAPELQPRVFDAFFTTARGRGHKGLGLTIVFNAVTGPLKGRIGLESVPGVGTTVTIIVPARLG